MITSLIGPGRYIKTLVASLPSSLRGNDQGSVCADDKAKIGLTNCEWASGANMVPDPGLHRYDHEEKGVAKEKVDQSRFFYKLDAARTGAASATITVQGRNTRSCRMYFDAPIFGYNVRQTTIPRFSESLAQSKGDTSHRENQKLLVDVPKNGGMQEGYEVGPKGIKEVRLWSRTWDKEFKVDVTWRSPTEAGESNSSAKHMQGRIACEWAEYQSAMIDTGNDLLNRTLSSHNDSQIKTSIANLQPKIPAIEETLAFLPHWSTVSKAADGLVEVWVPFVV